MEKLVFRFFHSRDFPSSSGQRAKIPLFSSSYGSFQGKGVQLPNDICYNPGAILAGAIPGGGNSSRENSSHCFPFYKGGTAGQDEGISVGCAGFFFWILLRLLLVEIIK